MFEPLKEALRVRIFASVVEVNEKVHTWIGSRREAFLFAQIGSEGF
jgi:hypothetical protein